MAFCSHIFVEEDGTPMAQVGWTAEPRSAYPNKDWERRTPAAAGLLIQKLEALARFMGGRGCIVRHGYLVFTWGDATKSGDIASLDPSPCPCGRTLARMSKVVGRADDMLVIRGVNVYPSEVEAVLLAEPAVGAQYLLVVDRTETMPSLVVVCELADGSGGDAERARAGISVALERRLALRPEVRVVPGGTLPRVEIGKVQRVVHRTADHDPLHGLGV